MLVCKKVKINKPGQEGFTLLEALFILFVSLTMMMFIPGLIKLMNDQHFNPHEPELFFYQLNQEVREAMTFKIKQNDLILNLANGEQITIEKYGSVIRRQVNGRGHEVFLQNVKNVSFYRRNHGVKVVVNMKNGEVIQKRLSLAPIKWGRNNE